MEMIKRINKHSIYLLVPLTVIGAFFDIKKAPISVILGGLIALANLKGLSWGVKGLINPETAEAAKGKLVFFSLLRLTGVFVILAIFLYLKLVDVLFLLLGITAVFMVIIREGLREARNL